MRDEGSGRRPGTRPCYPKGLLGGEDKFVRHIRLQKPSHIDEPAFRALAESAPYLRTSVVLRSTRRAK